MKLLSINFKIEVTPTFEVKFKLPPVPFLALPVVLVDTLYIVLFSKTGSCGDPCSFWPKQLLWSVKTYTIQWQI